MQPIKVMFTSVTGKELEVVFQGREAAATEAAIKMCRVKGVNGEYGISHHANLGEFHLDTQKMAKACRSGRLARLFQLLGTDFETAINHHRKK